jgi:hypothetical protein
VTKAMLLCSMVITKNDESISISSRQMDKSIPIANFFLPNCELISIADFFSQN